MYAYVFSMKIGEGKDLDFPPNGDLKWKVKGIKATGRYDLWISERDGRPSPSVGSFRGRTVKPNRRCPNQLHEMWVVRDGNQEDKD